MISYHDWWPWMKPGYITVTQRQSNSQWSGGRAAHPAPKNSEYKNLLEEFSPWFFGIKTASSSLIIFQRSRLSTRSVTHLCWYNWRTFEGKMLREGHQGGLVLSHRAFATQKKLAYLGLQCLDHPTYSPDLAPSHYHLFLGLKKQSKDHPFLSDVEVIAAAEIWLYRQPSEFFLSGLQKLEQWGKKCIELCGEYVE